MAAVDTSAVAESVAARSAAAADTLFDIVAGIAVAHSTAGTVAAAGFVGVHLHPCRCGSLRYSACRSSLLDSFQPLEFLPLGFRGA